MSANKPIWPKIPSPFVRAMLAGHSALGLAFAALIYLVCFSGTVAVLADEWRRWEQPGVAPLTEKIEPAAIDRAFSEGVALNPGAPYVFLSLPDKDAPRFSATIAIPGTTDYDERTVDADGHLGAKSGADAFTDFLIHLHINLHLPRTIGEFIVGLTGVALLSSLISGLLAHPRVFRDAFQLRWGGSKRLQEADLHNRVGVWALPFHIIVSLSGALLGLTTLLIGVLALVVFKGDINKAYDLFLPPHPAKNERVEPLPSVAPMLAAVARVAPDATVNYLNIANPGRADQTINITAKRAGQISNGDTYAFDSAGVLLAGSGPKKSLGASINNALGQAHFGWFGGLPIKIAYVLLGAGLTAVTASGVAIWLARRRDKGRPAPAWERIWTAFCWGQPPAYAATALAAMLAPGAPLPILWVAFTLLGMATCFVGDRMRISLVLRLSSVMLLAAVAIVHATINHARVRDPASWWIDGALICLSAIVALSVFSRKHIAVTANLAAATVLRGTNVPRPADQSGD